MTTAELSVEKPSCLNPFVAVPTQLIDHLNTGVINALSFSVLVLLLHECDWATGIYRGSAGRLAESLANSVERRVVQYRLEHLEHCGFIERILPPKGSHTFYPILINNYIPPVGPDKGRLLRATEIKNAPAKWKGHPRRKTNESLCTDETVSTQGQRNMMAFSSRTPRAVLDASASAQHIFVESSTHQGASNQDTQDVQDPQYGQKIQDSQEDQEYRDAQDSKPKDRQEEIRPPKAEMFGPSATDIEVKTAGPSVIPGRRQGQEDSSSAHGSAQRPELSPEELKLKQLEQAWRYAPEGTPERKAACAAYCAEKKAQKEAKAAKSAATNHSTAGGAQ